MKKERQPTATEFHTTVIQWQ